MWFRCGRTITSPSPACLEGCVALIKVPSSQQAVSWEPFIGLRNGTVISFILCCPIQDPLAACGCGTLEMHLVGLNK